MKIIITILLASTVIAIQCVKFLPKRIEVAKCDEKYFEQCKAGVNRYTRKGETYIYFEGTLLREMGNDITIHFVFEQYVNDEYQPTFLQGHGLLCNLLARDPYIGAVIRTALTRVGVYTCPLKTGYYKVKNISLTPVETNIKIPFKKARVQVCLNENSSRQTILEGFVFMDIFTGNKIKNNSSKQTRKKNKKEMQDTSLTTQSP